MTRILGALRPPGASVGRNRATDGFWLRPYLYVDFTRDRGKVARDRTPAQVARTGGAVTLSGMQRVANAGPGQVFASTGYHRFTGFGTSADAWTSVAVVSFVGSSGTTWAASRGASASNTRYSEILRIGNFAVTSGSRNNSSTPSSTNWARVTDAAIPGAAVGTSHVLATRQSKPSSSQSTITVWADGSVIGTDTRTDGSGISLERLTLGALDRSGFDGSTGQHVVVHAIWIWDRALTDEDIQWIMADPWQPLRRRSLKSAPAASTDLTGTLFQAAPTFFSGSTTAGSVDLGGALFQVAPAFNTGSIAATYDLGGTLFQAAPTFFTGSTTGSQELTGTLFQAAPTFNAGAVTPGAVDLVGTLLQVGPTFPQGAVAVGAVDLAGNLFALSPTFFAGDLATDQVLTGTLFQVAPSFFAGDITSTVDLDGALFQVAPTFFSGSTTTGPVDLAGVLFQIGPAFFLGGVTGGLRPRRRTTDIVGNRADVSAVSGRVSTGVSVNRKTGALQ